MRRRRIGSVVIVVAAVVYFGLPLLTLARFSFQRVPMARLSWSNLFDGWTIAGVRAFLRESEFWSTTRTSLTLALGTVVLALALLVPTALWVHLRAPRLRPVVETLTVLPYVVPPIALAVGVAAFRTTVPWFVGSIWCLVPVYTVLAMPFTYRSIDAGIRAIDLATMTEAARNLGAGWPGTVWRVLLPNLRSAIVASSFLTATVVLGEFAIASLLVKRTLPTYMAEFQGHEPQGGMALALTALIATACLLVAVLTITRRRGGTSLVVV